MSAALVGQLSVSPDHWEENVASQLSTDTYELCYNRACMLLYQQHHTAAEEMLQKAEGERIMWLFTLDSSVDVC